MTALRLLPAAFAAALLAAHFLRAGDFILAAAALAVASLLFVQRPWAARAVQFGLALASLEWLRTLASLVAARRAAGESFVRLAVILGAVTLLTAAAALLFETAALRARYGFRLRRSLRERQPRDFKT